MKKIAIFNVGGASSAYIEIGDKKIVVDIGKSQEFNPVLDFLLPLAKKKFNKVINTNIDKYQLTQVFLSHLDNDHISAIEEFDQYFRPDYLTAPCDHPKQNSIFSIIRDFFDKENKNVNKVLNLMSEDNRSPGHGTGTQEDLDRPLVVHRECQENIQLFHIPAGICADEDLLKEQYSNNLSLVVLFSINGYRVLFPGDLMSGGMEYLIENNDEFKINLTKHGVDFLITPHHGLDTAFPAHLFKTIKNNKVKLNIISEKKSTKEDKENRHNVDTRYSSPDFSGGHKIINGLKDFQYSIMTSNALKTHLLIDFDSIVPEVKRCTTEDLLNKFV
jgi:beta-lactamase superfamily II metal-dependent hydrolase